MTHTSIYIFLAFQSNDPFETVYSYTGKGSGQNVITSVSSG